MGESYLELYKEGIKVPIEEITGTTTSKRKSKEFSSKEKKNLLISI
jgi:hypothetical protein